MKIESFSGDYRFLSNFYNATAYVVLDGDEYPTVEHAYQASKTTNPDDRRFFRFGTARDAKRMGRSVILRSDWEEVKLNIMLNLLRQKFTDTDLTKRLLDTKDAELVEGNYWNDTYWGVCNGVGDNHLGKLLMQVRDELRESIDH